MTFRFREFRVYKEARVWLKDIFIQTFEIKRLKYYELANQIERASISVVINITEGSARGSDKDFNRFLDISLGSLNEVIAGFDIAMQLHLIQEKNFEELLIKSESLAKKLRAFKKVLQKL